MLPECDVSPMLALSVNYEKHNFKMLLNNGKEDQTKESVPMMDDQERCFLKSHTHGTVMLADAPRYEILSTSKTLGRILSSTVNRFRFSTPNLNEFTDYEHSSHPKTAITLDGKIASAGGDSKWITGESARLEGHRLRSQHDAILVGIIRS